MLVATIQCDRQRHKTLNSTTENRHRGNSFTLGINTTRKINFQTGTKLQIQWSNEPIQHRAYSYQNLRNNNLFNGP